MGSEAGGRFKREGTYVYLRPIRADVWQKPTQHCKTVILQLQLKIKELIPKFRRHWDPGLTSNENGIVSLS